MVDHGPYDYDPSIDDLLVLGNVHILDDREVIRYVECQVRHKGFDVAGPAPTCVEPASDSLIGEGVGAVLEPVSETPELAAARRSSPIRR